MRLSAIIETFLLIFIIATTLGMALTSTTPVEKGAEVPAIYAAEPRKLVTITTTYSCVVTVTTTMERIFKLWRWTTVTVPHIVTRTELVLTTRTRRETIVVPQVVNVGTGTEAPIWKTVFVPMVFLKVVKDTYSLYITTTTNVAEYNYPYATSTSTYIGPIEVFIPVVDTWTLEEKEWTAIRVREIQEKEKNRLWECFIASAAYGSALDPEVMFLRGFRDDYVLKTYAGEQFMSAFNAWYYSFSPGVAQFISHHALLRTVVRGALYPLIGIL